jgi:cytochrome c-type biogenesis protein CcmH
MTFWLLAIAIAIIASAVLYYAAAGRVVNATSAAAALDTHFRLQLGEIETDIAGGRLGEVEALTARAELAREVLRQRREGGGVERPAQATPVWIVPAAIALTLAIAFETYSMLGSPALPSHPFVPVPQAAATAPEMSVDDAVRTVEARLAAAPDDLRGWQVIGPVYMQNGRFADAERAFRQVLRLSPPTADSDTDLAEALMEQNGGQATGEAGDLLDRAAALDPHHVRSHFYLAAEAMREKDYASAVAQWKAIISWGQGNDDWMPTAQSGLAAAEAALAGKPLPDDASPPLQPTVNAPAMAAPAAGAQPSNPAQSPAILNMVKGLSDRLAQQGGTIDEWTQLVRSEIVLGDLPKAQAAYDAAKKAYPSATDRADLDGLAAQAGLKLDEAAP